MISIDEFKKVELKAGKVQSCENHPNADKLYVLKVDVGGGEVRQLVAGIRPWYPDPQALVGRAVVVVTNLQPATLRGVESQGMLLAATAGDTVALLTVDRDVPPGSPIS